MQQGFTAVSLVLLMMVPALATECGAYGYREAHSLTEQVSTLSWSPNGEQLAFDFERAIYVVEADGSRMVNLTRKIDPDEGFESIIEYSPQFASDGTRLAFITLRHKPGWLGEFAGGRWAFEIGTSSLDGSGYRRISSSEEHDEHPRWSPDGKSLAFSTRLKGSSLVQQVQIVSHDGSDKRELPLPSTLVRVMDIGWSPDSKLVALTGWERLPESNALDAQLVLYLMSADGSDVRRIGESFSLPAWSADGSKMALAKETVEGLSIFVGSPDGSNINELTDLYAIQPIGGGYAPIESEVHFASFGDSGKLDWSADGREIWVTNGGIKDGPPGTLPSFYGFYSINTETGMVHGIESMDWQDNVAIAPDRLSYAVFRPYPPYGVLSIVSLDGSHTRTVVRAECNSSLDCRLVLVGKSPE